MSVKAGARRTLIIIKPIVVKQSSIMLNIYSEELILVVMSRIGYIIMKIRA